MSYSETSQGLIYNFEKHTDLQHEPNQSQVLHPQFNQNPIDNSTSAPLEKFTITTDNTNPLDQLHNTILNNHKVSSHSVISKSSREYCSTQRSETSNEKKPRKNKPGKKFGAKKKSWVWAWFSQDSKDPNIAACDYCGKVIIRLSSDKGSPKKLSEHLKTHKVNIESINYNRSIPVNGHGDTFTSNGERVKYSQPEFSPQKQNEKQTNHLNTFESNKRRYLSDSFDNTTYSTNKFHKHLMEFLMENKLPISVIKSKSFQQLIYDLRNDSVSDLRELTGLYNSLIEVSRFGTTNYEKDNTITTTMLEKR